MVNVAVQTLPNGTKLQALLSTFSKFAKGWCNYVTRIAYGTSRELARVHELQWHRRVPSVRRKLP